MFEGCLSSNFRLMGALLAHMWFQGHPGVLSILANWKEKRARWSPMRKVYMGPPQEVVHIPSSHILWSHLTARHAGKCSLWPGNNFLETNLYSRIEGRREACIFGGQCLYHTTSSCVSTLHPTHCTILLKRLPLFLIFLSKIMATA